MKQIFFRLLRLETVGTTRRGFFPGFGSTHTETHNAKGNQRRHFSAFPCFGRALTHTHSTIGIASRASRFGLCCLAATTDGSANHPCASKDENDNDNEDDHSTVTVPVRNDHSPVLYGIVLYITIDIS